MQDQGAERPRAGTAQMLEPGLRRILAPNPSPMTFWGTNTYLVGESALAVIDPGPDIDAHLGAILAALAPHQSVSHIFVTHSHTDHSALAARLSETTGAAVHAFGASTAGQSASMRALAAQGGIDGGEGVDAAFSPHVVLRDGETVQGKGWSLTAFHTPGHFSNHLCLSWRDVMFTGDHVMGWASSMVSPPDGDLTAFMASCRRLQTRADRRFYAGHGAPVDDPAARLDWLIRHRLSREAQIIRALESAPASATELAARLYTDVAPALLPAAARNVLAHLIDLQARGLAIAPEGIAFRARFHHRL
ncbi:MAG: MBL fold metallo-hydrolase [Pseudomonadota bacterium]